MATINATLDYPAGDRSVVRITWPALANGDVGAPVTLPNWADRTVQVAGTFGAGGSVSVRGSNDGTNFVALSDPQGNALTFSSGAIKLCTEVPWMMRPQVTAGDGTTAITVTAVVRAPTSISVRS